MLQTVVMTRTGVIVVAFLLGYGEAQRATSPCPDVFQYETQKTDADADYWYGRIALTTDEELYGVWLHVKFDRAVESLANWFGEVSSVDNVEFTIKKADHVLRPGKTTSVRFYIKYNRFEARPNLESVRLNGKVVCDADKLHVSVVKTTRTPSTTITPDGTNAFVSVNEEAARPGGNQNSAVYLSTLNDNRYGTDSSAVTGSTNRYEEDKRKTTSVYDRDFYSGDLSPTRPTVSALSNQGAAAPAAPLHQCGTVNTKATPLVTHGEATVDGEWPWHAALYHAKGIDWTYICGASLITRSHLITAAHCVTRPQTSRPVNQDNLLVYLGKTDLRKFGTPGVQDRPIAAFAVHPNYNASHFGNDVAVLTVARPADVTNHVRPVCLWDGDVSLDAVVSKLGTVVGWGKDENGFLSQTLLKAQMPVVDTVSCLYSNPEFFGRFTSNTTFCAGFRNGTSVCNGDSGGGMVFPKQGTNPTTWQLRGLVSLSIARQEGAICDPNHYVVFTDVAKYLPWIRQVIS